MASVVLLSISFLLHIMMIPTKWVLPGTAAQYACSSSFLATLQGVPPTSDAHTCCSCCRCLQLLTSQVWPLLLLAARPLLTFAPASCRAARQQGSQRTRSQSVCYRTAPCHEHSSGA